MYYEITTVALGAILLGCVTLVLLRRNAALKEQNDELTRIVGDAVAGQYLADEAAREATEENARGQ